MGRAIVRQPQVFLFDEPLSNLDAKLRAQTRLEIQKLHRELGITSLFVTHDQVEAMTLAQRMIVMNGGKVEQIGTPDEVYTHPGSTFVASFIGAPPMNLINGTIKGNQFVIHGLALDLPALGTSAPTPAAEQSVILGVRPEHLHLADKGWPVRAEMIEVLGAERLIYARLGAGLIIVRTGEDEHAPAIGQTIFVAPRADRIYWFEAKTQRRV